jgi:hypothetical protein
MARLEEKDRRIAALESQLATMSESQVFPALPSAEPETAPTWTPPRQLALIAAEDMPTYRITSPRRRPARPKRRPWRMFGISVIFPVRIMSSKLHITGRQKHILKFFENNDLYFRLANPFLDTRLLISHFKTINGHLE